MSAAELVADPVAEVAAQARKAHSRIPAPRDLYGAQRKSSMRVNLANDLDLNQLARDINAAVKPWRATPLVPGATSSGAITAVNYPGDRRQSVGEWPAADDATGERALGNAVAAQPEWDRLPAASRAANNGEEWGGERGWREVGES